MKSKFKKISRKQHGPIIQKFRVKIILAYSVFAFNFVICRGKGSLNYAKVQVAKVQVIPQPVSVKLKEGYFQINNSTRIVSTSGRTDTVAYMLDSLLNIPTGYHLSPTNRNGENHNNVIIMKLNKTYDTDLGKEGYRLEISSSQIVISANEQNGLFYGMQTLLQLLPSDIASRTVISSVKWIVPCVSIMDYPRFKWRGLMFDVAYKFFSKEFVEKYIDEMAKYKFNVFHWHLTDHQGWRIQIEGLPNLTEIGAWHVPSKGGYYTPQDIREIIAYAKKRFVTIVPEIDVPYHSSALISSYPNISCFNLPAATLCVARDSTWLILNKIFTQVAKMFPSEYIHSGGDEVHTRNWREHSLDQDLMKREGITTIAGLQPYFDRKLEKIISSGGKKMVTWYEYPDRSGLPTSNTIFMA